MSDKTVLQAVHHVVEGTSRATGVDFCRAVVRHLSAALHVRCALVTECANPEKSRVRTLGFWIGSGIVDNVEYDLENTPCKQVISGETCSLSSQPGTPSPYGRLLPEVNAVSYAATPLISHDGEVIGHLAIFDDKPTDELEKAIWMSVLKVFSARAAAEIERKRSDDKLLQLKHSLEELLDRRTHELRDAHEALGQAYAATIEGWSRALDLRDMETESHCQRVTNMTLRLAHALGIPDCEIDSIRWGALLHDIGKMGIPDGILLKPGPLTEDEIQVMRRHPEYAFELLGQTDFLRSALDIPYYHHEKWDGTGYPIGLKGEEIPIAARMFSIVDVWDALKSDRPYRDRWPDWRVREHIQSLAGTHFDPKIVKVFMDVAYAHLSSTEQLAKAA